jgi:hypothetical protein
MQLSRIATWSWPKEGVLVEMRRALNGKFRFFADESVLLVSGFILVPFSPIEIFPFRPC